MSMDANHEHKRFGLLRASAAAAYLGLAPATLAKMRMRGDGPPFVKVGHRLVAYRESDLVAWTLSRTRTQTASHDVGAETNT